MLAAFIELLNQICYYESNEEDYMFKYKLEMFFIKIFIGFFKLFPHHVRNKMCEKIGRLAYKLIKSRREITHKNIKIAFPNLTEIEIKELAIKSYEIMTKSFIMPFWLPELLEVPNAIKLSQADEEYLMKLYNKSKGLILISLHTGFIDGSILLAKLFPLSDVVRKQKNPILDSMMTKMRNDLGLKIIYKGKSSVKELVKSIRKKEAIGLFSDHYDSSGLTIDFFDKKTKVSTGAVNLLLRYEPSLVFLYNVINDDNSCTIHIEKGFEPVKTGDNKVDMVENTKLMVEKFEEIIRKHPEQWMWFHKRWRD